MDTLEEMQSSEESYQPHPFPWRRVILAGALILLLLLAIFLPPLINLGKYRRSLTASMSEALGRPVYVGGMELHLLPMPGIVMTDFTVDEDPAFGYEPALHASSVVASLRLSSLWRGRLEVSRIRLEEANLNLVKNSAGQWSIGSVLLRASQIPNAPTGQRRAGGRPRFPYIEATEARIDFKDGPEKKPFSLTNAEFSMWQANADEWRVRLRAQPVRTDLQLQLSDTGEISVEGSLRRASSLDAMPVDLRAEWSGAQLGQASRLIAGIDSGWRGDLSVTSRIQGNVGDFRTQSEIRIGNLRRQEFQPPASVGVDATCRSEYHRVPRVFDNITCFWPIGGGHLLLTGSIQGFAAPHADLQLEINQVPASFPATVLGLLRPRAQNVTVTGAMNGSLHFTSTDRPLLTGDAIATGVSLRYAGGFLTLPALHFVAPPVAETPVRKGRKPAPPPPPPPLENAVQLQPTEIPMGEPEPLRAEAQFTQAGFTLHLAGAAALSRLLPAAANFGVLENSMTVAAPRGRAVLDTTTAGGWMRPSPEGGSGIETTGAIRVDGAELRPSFLPAPVEIESAEIGLTPQQIAWQNVALRYRKMEMQGSLEFPGACNPPVACPAVFTLASKTLDAAALETALGGDSSNGFLSQLLTDALGGGTPASWPLLRGQIQCDTMTLGSLALRKVTASTTVEGSHLTLSSFDAEALGGTLHASGGMTIENGAPHWTLNLHLENASAPDAAAAFEEKWGPGELNGEANLTLSGYRIEDLRSSASGDFSFTWLNGALPTAADASREPFDRWTAKGAIGKSALTIASGGLSRGGRTSAVRGSLSFDRDLDLTVETRRGRMKIAGTLAQPSVQ